MTFYFWEQEAGTKNANWGSKTLKRVIGNEINVYLYILLVLHRQKSFRESSEMNIHFYFAGILSHSDLDQRALDALKEFPPDGALGVLAQFLESNLAHVSNKSAFLCGVMKTYRQKSRGSNSISNAAGKWLFSS